MRKKKVFFLRNATGFVILLQQLPWLLFQQPLLPKWRALHSFLYIFFGQARTGVIQILVQVKKDQDFVDQKGTGGIFSLSDHLSLTLATPLSNVLAPEISESTSVDYLPVPGSPLFYL